MLSVNFSQVVKNWVKTFSRHKIKRFREMNTEKKRSKRVRNTEGV